MSRRVLPPIIILVVLAAGACGSTTPTSVDGASPAMSPGGTPGGMPSVTISAAASDGADGFTPTYPDGMIVGDGELVLDDPTVGLDALPGYRATLTTGFHGTDAGASVAWSAVSTFALSRTPRASMLTLEQTGSLEPARPSWIAELDGVRFERVAGGCSAEVADSSDAARREPAAELSGLVGGLPLGHDTINGTGADGFSFDQKALGRTGDQSVTGRIWLASDGGYVLRYDLTVTGGADAFGEGRSGTLTTAYELTAHGAQVSVDIPTACPPGLLDAPMPPDALDVVSGPGRLTFATDLSPAALARFYREHAASMGWTSAGTATITTDTAILDCTSSSVRLEIVARASAPHTVVTIVGTRR